MTALSLTPRTKVLASAALVALLAACSQAAGISAASAARAALAVAALAALVLWAVHSRRSAARPELRPRLQVSARAGLSQRCGVALVEADGRRYLVAYGDGFAQVLDALTAAPRAGRRGGRPGSRGGRS
jgi:hypothetical protein